MRRQKTRCSVACGATKPKQRQRRAEAAPTCLALATSRAGTAHLIGRFYSEVLGARVVGGGSGSSGGAREGGGGGAGAECSVYLGPGSRLRFTEDPSLGERRPEVHTGGQWGQHRLRAAAAVAGIVESAAPSGAGRGGAPPACMQPPRWSPPWCLSAFPPTLLALSCASPEARIQWSHVGQRLSIPSLALPPAPPRCCRPCGGCGAGGTSRFTWRASARALRRRCAWASTC